MRLCDFTRPRLGVDECLRDVFVFFSVLISRGELGDELEGGDGVSRPSMPVVGESSPKRVLHEAVLSKGLLVSAVGEMQSSTNELRSNGCSSLRDEKSEIGDGSSNADGLGSGSMDRSFISWLESKDIGLYSGVKLVPYMSVEFG